MGRKKEKIINMSSTKKETFTEMIIRAIPSIKDRKGASRTAIANWIQTNCGKESGSSFNAFLRNALKKGIDSGLLKEGATSQRFRIGQLPKPKKNCFKEKEKDCFEKEKNIKEKEDCIKEKESGKKEDSFREKEEIGIKKEGSFKEKERIKKEKGGKKKKKGAKKKKKKKKKKK